MSENSFSEFLSYYFKRKVSLRRRFDSFWSCLAESLIWVRRSHTKSSTGAQNWLFGIIGGLNLHRYLKSNNRRLILSSVSGKDSTKRRPKIHVNGFRSWVSEWVNFLWKELLLVGITNATSKFIRSNKPDWNPLMT